MAEVMDIAPEANFEKSNFKLLSKKEQRAVASMAEYMALQATLLKDSGMFKISETPEISKIYQKFIQVNQEVIASEPDLVRYAVENQERHIEAINAEIAKKQSIDAIKIPTEQDYKNAEKTLELAVDINNLSPEQAIFMEACVQAKALISPDNYFKQLPQYADDKEIYEKAHQEAWLQYGQELKQQREALVTEITNDPQKTQQAIANVEQNKNLILESLTLSEREAIQYHAIVCEKRDYEELGPIEKIRLQRNLKIALATSPENIQGAEANLKHNKNWLQEQNKNQSKAG